MMTERVKDYCMNAVRQDLERLAGTTRNIKTSKDAAIYAGKSEYLKGIVMDLYGEDA